jgi:hypothetical protein
MGKYFNPANKEALDAAGRNLIKQDSFADYKKLLQAGEVLVGLFDRGIFKNAPVLPDEAEYEEFMKQVRSGTLKWLGFFAVLENHPSIQ